MVKRVVLAYDGSDLAREAFAYAVMLAKAIKVPVLGVTVLESGRGAHAPGRVLLHPGAIAGRASPDGGEGRSREDAERDLDDLVDYAEDQEIELDTRLLEGELRECLVDVTRPGDLLAVGLKGRFATGVFGSMTRWLVEHAPCPLMVVSGELRPVNRVVAVYDGSAQSRRAVEWTREISKAAGWPTTVLAAAGPVFNLDGALRRAQQLAPEAQVIHYGHEDHDYLEQIEAAAEHATCSIMALGAYAHTLIEGLLFHASTERVIKSVKGPIVLVR